MTVGTRVLTICGSLRKGSYNASLVRSLPELAPAGMAFTPAPSYREIPLYDYDLQNSSGFPAVVTAFADAIRSADGILIASPEYNWSIPGGLKNAIDWVSRMKDQPFKDKPVALQSASTSLIGGARMQYQLRQSLLSVDAVLLGRPEVIVTFAPQKFDGEGGALKDEATRGVVRQQLAAFAELIGRYRAHARA